MQTNLIIGGVVSVVVLCVFGGDGIIACLCIMGFVFLGGLFGGIDAYEPPSKSSNSNFYKAASIHQRQKHQQELDELNEEVEDMNDRMDGFG